MKFNLDTFNPKKPYAFDPPYTPAQIAIRIEEAVKTDRRMPRVKSPRVVCYWPEILRDYWEAYNMEKARYSLGRPTNKQISEMDEVVEWLSVRNGYVNTIQSRVLWLRSAELKWKQLEKIFDYSDDTLRKEYENGLLRIWSKLGLENAQGSTRKHGMRAMRGF